ncbi:MAG TPA: hypothetical protein PLE43_05110 [Alphaproteobacteria bacterium]|nr:hypothetical protein [Alphaproteobacteria bacterium]
MNATTQRAPGSELNREFNALAVINAGLVSINQLSRYLKDLPNTAVADLLVAPQDTATLFGRGLGTFNEDAADIRRIGKEHGIHADGALLIGMQISDRLHDAQNMTYEEAWAFEVRVAWQVAMGASQAVTTGLAIGVKQIVDGCGTEGATETRSLDGRSVAVRAVTVAHNLRSNVTQINAALREQGGQEISTLSSHLGTYFTASEHPEQPNLVMAADFCGSFTYDLFLDKAADRRPSRPVALRIRPDLQIAR